MNLFFRQQQPRREYKYDWGHWAKCWNDDQERQEMEWQPIMLLQLKFSTLLNYAGETVSDRQNRFYFM